MGLPTQEISFAIIFSRLDTMHQLDRQTDGQTDGHRATAKTAFTHSVARQKRVPFRRAQQNPGL